MPTMIQRNSDIPVVDTELRRDGLGFLSYEGYMAWILENEVMFAKKSTVEEHSK